MCLQQVRHGNSLILEFFVINFNSVLPGNETVFFSFSFFLFFFFFFFWGGGGRGGGWGGECFFTVTYNVSFPNIICKSMPHRLNVVSCIFP